MASVSTDSKGNKRVHIVVSGDRKPIYLGKVSVRLADEVKRHSQRLADAKRLGDEPDRDTRAWLDKIDDDLHNKLSRIGLAADRKDTTVPALGEFLRSLIDARSKMKPNTRKNWLQTVKSLVGFFKADRKLADINQADGTNWKADQEGDGYAPATISRNVKRGKQFFAVAVQRGFIKENPLQHLKAAKQVNKTRQFFIARETIDKLLDYCPDSEWQLIILLARFGGLRIPSELEKLKWDDILWSVNKILVHSPKTEHHPGGATRLIPLFPELKRPLEDAYFAAEEGSTYIISAKRRKAVNLRTGLGRILDRAGTQHWPKIWQNMRSTRETELCREYDIQDVVVWMGNSEPVAKESYLQTTEAAYQKAAGVDTKDGAQNSAPTARKAAQYVPVRKSTLPQETTQPRILYGVMPDLTDAYGTVHQSILPPRGVEPLFSD